MEKKKLTYEQNIRSALVFLNTFGLKMEEKEVLTDGTSLKVYDNINIVGKVDIVGEKVVIKAALNHGILEASYDVAKFSGFIDYESNNAKFMHWETNISYSVKDTSEKKVMTGDFIITCSADSEYGIKCLCHPTFSCSLDNGTFLELQIQKNGNLFKMESTQDDLYEMISVRPYDGDDGYFRYILTKEKYDHDCPYMEVYTVSDKSALQDHILQVRHIIDKHGDISVLQSTEVERNDELTSDQSLEQVIDLIQKVGGKAFERIQQIVDYFRTDQISLIHNFIAVSMTSYTDDEIKGLLGINRVPMQFQNGTDNLMDAYFGINQNDVFKLHSKGFSKIKKLTKKIQD